MKTNRNVALVLVLAFVCMLSLAACSTGAEGGLWETATYQKDKTFGDGEKTVVVEVTADEKTVTFTIKTDAETVGEALLEHDLIAGDESEYGLYVKEVNGILADYDVDQTYWAFYLDGEYAMNGIDAEPITEGVTYQLVRSK